MLACMCVPWFVCASVRAPFAISAFKFAAVGGVFARPGAVRVHSQNSVFKFTAVGGVFEGA